MSHFIKTFVIRDQNAEADELQLTSFVGSVDVVRMETCYDNGAWRVFVMYNDLRHREEQAQIESALLGALTSWRKATAQAAGVDSIALLSDGALLEISRAAPTTAIELTSLPELKGVDLHKHAPAIVQVVRQTLDDLAL